MRSIFQSIFIFSVSLYLRDQRVKEPLTEHNRYYVGMYEISMPSSFVRHEVWIRFLDLRICYLKEEQKIATFVRARII